MKITSWLLGAIFVFIFFIFFPIFFIWLNTYFNLPVIHSSLLDILGILLIVTGAFPPLYSFFLFITVGKGTPVPTDPPKKFVVAGFYKYTRNPMYTGYMIIFFGVFLLLGPVMFLLYLLLAFTFFNLFTIVYEEPNLRKRFGQPYIDYCQRVPRWGIKNVPFSIDDRGS